MVWSAGYYLGARSRTTTDEHYERLAIDDVAGSVVAMVDLFGTAALN
jgi:hypothetical protein